jgi:CubicO group peptidase (beta-lactamase class C family)
MKNSFLTVSLVVVGLVAFTPCLFAEDLFPAVPVHELDERAFVREWVVLGPFPNPEVDEVFADGSSHFGYSTDLLVDIGGESKARLTQTMVVGFSSPDGAQEFASARRVSAGRDGAMDLDGVFGGVDHKVAYAACTVVSERDQEATFLFGSDDGAKVWINGELVHSIYEGRGLSFGEDRFTATLQRGENSVLIKVADRVRSWGFAIEALDPIGYSRFQAEEREWNDFVAFLDTRVRPAVGNEWDYSFGPGELPDVVWTKPYLVKEVMGEFELSVRWFDADLNEVATAEKPGRYGYVVDATTPTGIHIRRAGTVFCRPDDWYGWSERPRAELDYVPLTTVNRDVWQTHEDAIADFVGHQVLLSILRQEEGAILMAFLHEMQASGVSASVVDTPSIRDHDYHLALKRKLMAVEDVYPELARPKALAGDIAPVLRKGSSVEAGVSPDTADRIREVCEAWFEASGEPFDLLVARHGVIVIHEAFGDWPWGGMTLETPKPVASITKLITGVLFALFVDQGLIGIDDPVGLYLPDFPVDGVNVPTLRHCFTHTMGLWGHQEWGGMHNPYLENVAANAVTRLPVGEVHDYTGMGYDLAGKVMEVVSGKSIFRLLRENLFDPLEMNDTSQEEDLGFSCNTTAGDLAVIGQLLLNRGSYGDLEFFSSETFDQLVPKPLDRYWPEIHEEWGIGLTWMRQPHPDAGIDGVAAEATILSRNVIGHGSATSSVLRVDLDNGLVIAQTRRIGGKRYDEHLERLLLAIEAGLLSLPGAS